MKTLTAIGDGRTDIDLRGLGAKETLVLQDGRRLAPDGFAGYYNDANAFFGGTVDLNLFPLGLIDHIDILKDGASAIYGSDAVGGVFNVWLIHRFRGLEIYASYGNTNLGASNDQGKSEHTSLPAPVTTRRTWLFTLRCTIVPQSTTATGTFPPTLTLPALVVRIIGRGLCRACRRLRLPAGP
jgi:Outer membrane cobalamin receptor protein